MLAPPGAGEIDGLSIENLFATPTLSAHLASADEPIPAHYHARHEETVYVVAGRARMWIDGEAYELEPGMLVHVPRGAVHSVEPEGPSSVLSIFTPPFDGKDRVFLDAK